MLVGIGVTVHYGGVTSSGSGAGVERVLDPAFCDGLGDLPLETLRAHRDDAALEETDLSYLRRLLHGRIDIVEAEQRRRTDGGSISVVEDLVRIFTARERGPAAGSGRHQRVAPSHVDLHETLASDIELSDVTSLSELDLAELLEAYRAEEAAVSIRRRDVQKVVDRFNGEIASRYARGAASVDELLAAEGRRS